MKMIQQFLILAFFALMGHLLAMVIPLPGLVLAMILLFTVLKLNLMKADALEPFATQLIAVSGLYFIPHIVGILAHIEALGYLLVPFLLAVTFGTLIPLGLVAILLQWMINLQDRKSQRKIEKDKA